MIYRKKKKEKKYYKFEHFPEKWVEIICIHILKYYDEIGKMIAKL